MFLDENKELGGEEYCKKGLFLDTPQQSVVNFIETMNKKVYQNKSN
jgi:hypothetical protein